jgi:hypothetical protein
MMNKFDGPIPGENYTSDTKNYAWHRPPEFDDLDKAIDYIGKKLTKPEAAVGLLTMIEAGLPITDLTQTFIMSGIGDGKWTLDFGLLLAGPVAHIMQIMAKSYGIKFNLGLSDKLNGPPTRAFLDTVHEINRAKAVAAGRDVTDAIDDIQANTQDVFKSGTLQAPMPMPKFKGFASAPNPNKGQEQSNMLGQEAPPGPSEGGPV